MKIGIDARLWNESGVGRYIRNLVANLQVFDNKNEYVLFALEKDQQDIHLQIPNPNFNVIAADIRWHTLEEQIALPKVLNKENLDLVHFPYFSIPFFYNKPFVVTIHDLILHHFPTGEASTLPIFLYDIKVIGYKFIIAKAAKKAKKIITVSQTTKEEIVDHLKIDQSKIVVTYEGVDFKESGISPSGDGQELGIKGKYFLHVGNVYPHKNVERLLKAFEALAQKQSDINLVFVGKDDFFFKRLRKKVNLLSCKNKIIFLGFVSDAELSALYENALAVVIPSLMEGFGLPALEAMTNNCVVLASDIKVFHEICADAALFLNPQDVHDIVEKLRKVYSLERDHRSKIIKKGHERAQMFSWEKMAKETLEIYESGIGL